MFRFTVPTTRQVCNFIANVITALSAYKHGSLGIRIIFVSVFSFATFAAADSASGVNTLFGNDLNPQGTDTTRRIDPNGISLLKRQPSRTPSGLLYNTPYTPPEYKLLMNNWRYRGSLEFGYLGNDGDEQAAEFNDYSDWSDGPLLNYFDISAWDKFHGYFLDIYGGGVAREDQYYHISTGRYAAFKVSGFYNQIPHSYSRNAVTIFQGAGSESLTLPFGLQPGNNSNAQIQQALQFAYQPNLGLRRDRGGVGLEFIPWQGFTLFADFNHETRNGSRPFGGSFLPPFYTDGAAGGMVETIEPIDYVTNEIISGIRYVDNDLQLNLNYTGSFFTNKKSQLTFENPFTNLPGTDFIIERGRIALYPDNNFHQIKADLAYRLPLRGQLTSTFSWSRMHQDDDLIPATVNSGPTFTGIDMDQWNTLGSLPRQQADANIEQWLFQLGAQLSPLKDLTLRAKFRYQDENNQTAYSAFNSVTNQIGYIAEDGAVGGAVFQPGTRQQAIHYRSIPFAQRSMNWLFDSDYRLTLKTTAGIAYGFEQIIYDYREREKTSENRVKFHLSSRSLSWATLRLSYEYANRDGTAYNFDPYTPFYTTSLPGFQSVLPDGPRPHTLANLRKYDLSSRQQNLLNAQLNFLLRTDMDLLLAANWVNNDYDANYGLLQDQSSSVNLEWNYQPLTTFNTYAYYSFQNRNNNMANINDVGFSTDPNAGGGAFPFAAAWWEKAHDNNHLLGLGMRYLLGRFDMDSRYSYNWSNNAIDYTAASNQALANPLFDAQTAGNAFPDISHSRHIVETSLRWHFNNDFALRFYHRYEHGKTSDWHYQGLQPLIGNQLYLNATPENYQVNVFGVFLQYRLQ